MHEFFTIIATVTYLTFFLKIKKKLVLTAVTLVYFIIVFNFTIVSQYLIKM